MDGVDEAGWYRRRRVVYVWRDRKREAEGLMTGPSSKAIVSLEGQDPVQGMRGYA